jgi:hypothetical protein
MRFRPRGRVWQHADVPPSAAIEHYLRTGDHDPHFPGWSGDTLERERRARGDLKRALVDEVRRRAAGRRPSVEMPAIDLTIFTRAKVEPMVRGLFPRSEQERMLGVLERSVVFLTPDRVESILLGCTRLTSAWELANLYLGSLDAELLAEDAPRIVGLSEETTCFVSLDYFAETHRFADFIVHEAAHVFHNCERRTVRFARDASPGVAARDRFPETRDVRLRLRSVQPGGCVLAEGRGPPDVDRRVRGCLHALRRGR